MSFEGYMVKEKCPICKVRDNVGSIGPRKFFCSECCAEFEYKGGKLKVHNVTPSGLVEEILI